MKPLHVILLVAVIILGCLALTNPNEAQYRGHVQESEGILGTLGLGLADLLSQDASKGIHRENYLIASKFYVGGDGLLPRQDLAWGMAGKFWDIERERTRK